MVIFCISTNYNLKISVVRTYGTTHFPQFTIWFLMHTNTFVVVHFSDGVTYLKLN